MRLIVWVRFLLRSCRPGPNRASKQTTNSISTPMEQQPRKTTFCLSWAGLFPWGPQPNKPTLPARREQSFLLAGLVCSAGRPFRFGMRKRKVVDCLLRKKETSFFFIIQVNPELNEIKFHSILLSYWLALFSLSATNSEELLLVEERERAKLLRSKEQTIQIKLNFSHFIEKLFD